MITRVFLVRHGQTVYNREQVFRGRLDVPLNEAGLAEAELVGAALAAEPISFIYSSPLARAVQTVTPLAKRKNIPITGEQGFIDMNFGKWEGVKVEEVAARYPEAFSQWTNSPQACIIDGGENLQEVQVRVVEAWKKVVSEQRGKTGIVVSHRVICKLLILGLLGLGPEAFWKIHQDTAAINYIVADDDKPVIHRLNDTSHLNSLKEGRVTADF